MTLIYIHGSAHMCMQLILVSIEAPTGLQYTVLRVQELYQEL